MIMHTFFKLLLGIGLPCLLLPLLLVQCEPSGNSQATWQAEAAQAAAVIAAAEKSNQARDVQRAQRAMIRLRGALGSCESASDCRLIAGALQGYAAAISALDLRGDLALHVLRPSGFDSLLTQCRAMEEDDPKRIAEARAGVARLTAEMDANLAVLAARVQ